MKISRVWLVLRRELRSSFVSPIGYIVAVVFLGITGWLFFSTFFLEGRGDLRGFFELLPITLALVAPAITMRQLSEELSSGTYEAVLTLPLRAAEILLGKFAAALTFVILVLLPTLSYPLSIAGVTSLDWGPVIGGYIGAVLLAGLYCAVGLLASSASRNQILAFVLALAACAFLALIDRVLFALPGPLVATLEFLSGTAHFRSVARGVLDTRDIIYFVSFGAGALFAAHTVMQVRRG
jgi:ABC-2 type transport system permease protein